VQLSFTRLSQSVQYPLSFIGLWYGMASPHSTWLRERRHCQIYRLNTIFDTRTTLPTTRSSCNSGHRCLALSSNDILPHRFLSSKFLLGHSLMPPREDIATRCFDCHNDYSLTCLASTLLSRTSNQRVAITFPLYFDTYLILCIGDRVGTKQLSS